MKFIELRLAGQSIHPKTGEYYITINVAGTDREVLVSKALAYECSQVINSKNPFTLAAFFSTLLEDPAIAAQLQ